ncbi:MAG: hypothetical protein ACRDHM_00055 [Actinomycetota bacterium]
MAALRSHDQGFVAAAPGEVYRLIDDPATYPSWWTGSRLQGDDLSLPITKAATRAERQREGIGLHLVFGEESLEWYLETFEEGTIVNAFLDVRTSRSEWRGARRLTRMRSALRRGLVGLKKRLEART